MHQVTSDISETGSFVFLCKKGVWIKSGLITSIDAWSTFIRFLVDCFKTKDQAGKSSNYKYLLVQLGIKISDELFLIIQ